MEDAAGRSFLDSRRPSCCATDVFAGEDTSRAVFLSVDARPKMLGILVGMDQKDSYDARLRPRSSTTTAVAYAWLVLPCRPSFGDRPEIFAVFSLDSGMESIARTDVVPIFSQTEEGFFRIFMSVAGLLLSTCKSTSGTSLGSDWWYWCASA